MMNTVEPIRNLSQQQRNEAVQLYTLSANQGNVAAMRSLASCYLDGVGTDKNFELAVEWLETAAEQKDHLACAMLARVYDSWPNIDEEKKIYWHKKAAEYGNSDSMFALGRYYGKKGENQDLVLASNYYDNAAQNGTPEMKLKVAKAFDVPAYGNEPAINLDKAKYWYCELFTCEDDNILFESAQGLDEQTDWNGTIIRPALDINRAYMAYCTLAMKGNKPACSLAAYCSVAGRGTTQDIDSAIMYYQKAGEFDKAAWCIKKKSGNLNDPVYEANVENEMPAKIADPYSHGKEYYRGWDADLRVDEYNGLFYFIAGCYVCTSDEQGNNIKIVSKIPADYSYGSIHVNCTGIYLYYIPYTKRSDGRFLVLHLDFDGTPVAECKVEYGGSLCSEHPVGAIYIYGNDLYYVYTDYADENCIECMHIDIGRIERLYSGAGYIGSLYATDGYIIFRAAYENDEQCVFGWMIMNTVTNEVECISNPYCSPENVIDHLSYYDPESSDYNEKCNFDRPIIGFDLSRKIFWIVRFELEGDDIDHLHKVEYWEPRNLWGNRDELVPGMPVWRFRYDRDRQRRYEYFDGTVHYWAEDNHVFRSSSKYGKIYDWSRGNEGYGRFLNFKVVGGSLFLDVSVEGEEQYPLTVGISSPIRKSWFDRYSGFHQKALPQIVIEEFEKNMPIHVDEFDKAKENLTAIRYDCGKQEQSADMF